MRHKALRLGLVMATILSIVSISIQAQGENVDLDVLTATYQGHSLLGGTLDDITDIFGRPSLIKYDEEESGSGTVYAYVYFFQQGVTFELSGPASTELKCRSFTVNLIGSIDMRSEQHVGVFEGSISKDVNSNWKSKRVIDEFSEYKAYDQHEKMGQSGEDAINEYIAVAKKSVELSEGMIRESLLDVARASSPKIKEAAQAKLTVAENAKKLSESLMATTMEMRESLYSVSMNIPDCIVVFVYDPDTKFINKIRFIRTDKSVEERNAAIDRK